MKFDEPRSSAPARSCSRPSSAEHRIRKFPLAVRKERAVATPWVAAATALSFLIPFREWCATCSDRAEAREVLPDALLAHPHLLTPGGAVGDASPSAGLGTGRRSMSRTGMPP